MMEGWHEAGRYVVEDCPEFLCELQEFRRGNDQMVFIHLTTENWSLKTLRKMQNDFALLRECVTCPLYACGNDTDEKWAQFISLFGFRPLTEAVCTDGKRRRIFVHFKDKNNNADQFTVSNERVADQYD